MAMITFEDLPSTNTPINASNLNNNFTEIFNILYPVGSYFFTSDSTFDPNVAWGGTWTKEEDGTVLSSKSTTTGSILNANISAIVGSDTHTLTINEMPKHYHGINDGTGIYGYNFSGLTIGTTAGSGFGFAGGDQPHSIVQKTKIAIRWHRTA